MVLISLRVKNSTKWRAVRFAWERFGTPNTLDMEPTD